MDEAHSSVSARMRLYGNVSFSFFFCPETDGTGMWDLNVSAVTWHYDELG